MRVLHPNMAGALAAAITLMPLLSVSTSGQSAPAGSGLRTPAAAPEPRGAIPTCRAPGSADVDAARTAGYRRRQAVDDERGGAKRSRRPSGTHRARGAAEQPEPRRAVGGGQRRRLQQLLDRPRRLGVRGRRPAPNVDHRRSGRRQDSAADAEARQRNAARAARPSGRPPTRRRARSRSARGAYDNIELRPLAERCILGFGSTSGPPTLPNYFYNNLKQIVQTPDYVVILVEMVHDARIIPLEQAARPAAHPEVDGRFDRPLGRRHAGGRNDELHRTRRGSADRRENMKVIERFTRVDDEDDALSVHRRGSGDLDDSRGRANIPGSRPTSTSTSTPAMKATTPWETSFEASGFSTPSARKKPPG